MTLYVFLFLLVVFLLCLARLWHLYWKCQNSRRGVMTQRISPYISQKKTTKCSRYSHTNR